MGRWILALVLMALLVLPMSLKVIREDRRGVVFRLGHFLGIRGPGLFIIIPFVDRVEQFDLGHLNPQWRSMADVELEAQIKALVLSVHHPPHQV